MPMTSTTTNAAACANTGAASFLRSRVTTEGPLPLANLPARTWCYCSHHGLGGIFCDTVTWVPAVGGDAAPECDAAAGTGRGSWVGGCCHHTSCGTGAGGGGGWAGAGVRGSGAAGGAAGNAGAAGP